MADFSVVFIDDDVQEAKSFENVWCSILKKIWPSVDITYHNDFDDIEFIRGKRPHIVLVDNVEVDENGEENNNRGLELISKVKPVCADSLFILFTNNSLQISSVANRQPVPDLIVAKSNLPNDDYENEITESIIRLLTRLPIGKVSYSNSETFSHASISINEVELQSLIEQCLFTFLRHGLTSEETGRFKTNVPYDRPTIEHVNLSAITGGYSGAVVFNCTLQGDHAPSENTFVLKISDRKSISREIRAYDTFVRLQMPHHLRVDLVGVGQVEENSAIFYGFAFGGPHKVASLTDYIKNEDLRPLHVFLDNIVGRTPMGWYKISEEQKVVIEQYVNNSPEYRPQKEPKLIRNISSNLRAHLADVPCKLEDEFIEIYGKRYVTARMLLRKFRGKYLHTCICHGDLNSNNIVVLDEKDRVSVIDFERTGVEPISKDFISLETSLVAHWPFQIEQSNLELWLGKWSKFESDYLSGAFEDVPEESNFSDQLMLLRGKFEMKLRAIDDIADIRKEFLLLNALHTFKLLGLEIWSEQEFCRLFVHYLSLIEALQIQE